MGISVITNETWYKAFSLGGHPMIVLDVVADIAGEDFARLLSELASNAKVIGFVIRGESVTPETNAFLKQIEDQKLGDALQTAWPGTTLVGDYARVLEYRASQSVVDAVSSFAAGLFDWSTPSALEDLFIKSTTAVLLETVGHERLALTRVAEMSPLLGCFLNQRLVKVYDKAS